MINRLLIFVLSTVSALSLTAQRVNQQGQKLVKRISITELTDYLPNLEIYVTFDFTYSSDGKLNKCVWKHWNNQDDGERYQITLEKRGDNLIRTELLNGRQVRDYWYVYNLVNDRIDKREVYVDQGHSILRHDLEFYYTYGEGSRLQTVSETWFYKERGMRDFRKGDGKSSMTIKRLDARDGNFIMAESFVFSNGQCNDYPFRYENYLYSDKLNDTNINWNALFEYYCGQHANWESPEFYTEWVGAHSKNLIDGKRKSAVCDFEYIYDGENLIHINKYIGTRSFKQLLIDIEYVM